MTKLSRDIDEFRENEKGLPDRKKIPYPGPLPGSGGGSSITHKLRNPNIPRWYGIMDAPYFEQQAKPAGPVIDGSAYNRIVYGPLIYDPERTYLRQIPHTGSTTGWHIFNRLHNKFPTQKSLYMNGPLDWADANLYTKKLSDRWRGKWTVVLVKHEYIRRQDYNYTLDTTTNLEEFIRLLKLFPLAGVSPYDYGFWRHHMESLFHLAYWHFMGIIHRGTWIAKWEDLPSLTASNDVQLNKLLRQPDDWLRSSARYNVTNISKRDNKYVYYSLYHYTKKDGRDLSGFQWRNGLLTLRWVRNPDTYGWPPAQPNWSETYNPHIRQTHPLTYHLDVDQDDFFTENDLYLPKSIVLYAKKAIKRSQDLLLASLQKTIAIQTAVEDEDEHIQHDDYTDPYENPFLIYNPAESKIADKPIFTDVSLRPGKQNVNYTSNRISLKTFDKMPGRFREMVRYPDAEGKMSQKGGGEETKGSFLPLIALAGAGAYIYTQVRG